MIVRFLPSHRRSPTLAALALVVTSAGAADAPADGAALQHQIDELNARLKALEKAPASTTGNSVANGLSFGAYGEMKFGLMQNPADDGHWQNGFDGGRVTLLPSYQVTDKLLFKAEIEFEHGGIAFAEDDKSGGAIEIEQAYLDLTINEYFHWRMPGVDIVPFGYTNLFHEPIYFYSVERPELANGLIPTTWFAGSTSIHGQLVGPVSYQFQISSTLIDNGGHVNDVTEAHGPADLGYPAGVSGSEALGLSRPGVGDFGQQSNELGYALRLAYQIPDARGLAGSTSIYYSNDIEPRHAYASDANNVRIGDLGRCGLIMVDTELRYRPQTLGIELRAEAVGVSFSNPENLRANNDGDPENNVGRTMWGVSGELAWHFQFPNEGWEVVPFYRYTREVLQTVGVSGADDNSPNGSGRINYHTLGFATFPAPSVVLKVSYQVVRDDTSEGAKSDSLLGGVGFFF